MRSRPHVRIAPSILDADFGRMAEQIALIERGGADVLHLDVMDGHFVPNLSFGVPVVASLRKCTGLFFDTHLMISDPATYAPKFVAAGSQSITFHVEVVDDAARMVRQIRDLGVKVGVALNPTTPIAAIERVLSDVDIVLVMTVWPGFGGQKLITDCLPKIEALSRRLRPEQWLEVDGGVNHDTVVSVVAAGADTLVTGSVLFGAPDPVAALRRLRGQIDAAVGSAANQTCGGGRA